MGLSLHGRIASNQPLHERSLSACNHRIVPPRWRPPCDKLPTRSDRCSARISPNPYKSRGLGPRTPGILRFEPAAWCKGGASLSATPASSKGTNQTAFSHQTAHLLIGTMPLAQSGKCRGVGGRAPMHVKKAPQHVPEARLPRRTLGGLSHEPGKNLASSFRPARASAVRCAGRQDLGRRSSTASSVAPGS
jgi:hypothetical protein